MSEDELKEYLASHPQVSHQETLILCLATAGEGPVMSDVLKRTAVQAGRRSAKKWKVATLLRRTGNLAVLVPGGWELTTAGVRHVENLTAAVASIKIKTQMTPRRDRSPIKILFLASNPSGSSPLHLDREARSIIERLRASPNGDLFEFNQEWAVRASDLQAALMRHRPDIVHLSGHGARTGNFILDGEDGCPVAVEPTALRELFRLVGSNVKAVVLNACFSDLQAVAITDVVACVIGMNDSIGDKAAIVFSSSFYQGLAFGQSLKTAFELGRNQIALSGLTDHEVPKLRSRVGINPDSLTLVA